MENITKTYAKKEICTHKEDYTRKHMKGKNEVITYINKIFCFKAWPKAHICLIVH